jgi:hypothetical protein
MARTISIEFQKLVDTVPLHAAVWTVTSEKRRHALYVGKHMQYTAWF